jgi:hypothetical protein
MIPVFDDKGMIQGYLKDDGRFDRNADAFRLHVILDRLPANPPEFLDARAPIDATFVIFRWRPFFSSRGGDAVRYRADCLVVAPSDAPLLMDVRGFVPFAEHHGRAVP